MLAQAWQVEKSVGATLAPLLKLARSCYQRRNTGTALAVVGNRGQRGSFAGDGQVQVYAVEQGAGKLVAVPLNLITAAATAPSGVAEISTILPATFGAMDIILVPDFRRLAGKRWCP